MIRKKLVRKRFLVAVVLALVCIGLCWYNYKADVILTISIPKKEYKLGDEIPVIWRLKHKGLRELPNKFAWLEDMLYPGGRSQHEVLWKSSQLILKNPSGSVCVNSKGMFALIVGLGGEDPGWLIEPGEVTTDTLSLNDYGLIGYPGTYTVIGCLKAHPGRGSLPGVVVQSKPIEVVVKARSHSELGSYIAELMQRYRNASKYAEKEDVLAKLAYTRDKRIVPLILDLLYADEHTQSVGRLLDYALPIEIETKEMLLHAARERGLRYQLVAALWRFGCSKRELEEVIGLGLQSDDPVSVKASVFAATLYPADSHTPRLSELAKDSDSPVCRNAIRALTYNRTEKALCTLRELLQDPNETVRNLTRRSIKFMYRGSDWLQKPYDAEKGSDRLKIVADKDDPDRWQALGDLLCEVFDVDRLKALHAFIEDPQREISLVQTDEPVKTIVRFLTDPDKDIRDVTTTYIRWAERARVGRRIQPKDFPEIYEEYKKERDNGEYDL